MSFRRMVATATTLAAVGLAGCDSGPSGPGMVAGTVTGDPQLGAVVLDITWRGIQGFEGLGATQAYSALVTDSENRYRVILVDPNGGDLRFGINVDDVYLEGPVVTVVFAAGTDDLPRSVAGLDVLLER